MISDVLMDAVYEIEQYQDSMPHIYDAAFQELSYVKMVMERTAHDIGAIPDGDGKKGRARCLFRLRFDKSYLLQLLARVEYNISMTEIEMLEEDASYGHTAETYDD